MKTKMDTILTTDLRNELKAVFANEIKNIPEYVTHENGESGEYEMKLYS